MFCVRRTTPSESDEEFYVEEILDGRGRGGSTEYLVKWEGYPEPTWTWRFNCNCPVKLAEFSRRRRVERRYQQAREAGRPALRRRAQGRRPSLSLQSQSSASYKPSVNEDSEVPPEVLGSDMPCTPTINSEPACIVCLENKITHIVQPCNHACLCSRCTVAVATLHGCPKCRGSMKRIAPFYIG